FGLNPGSADMAPYPGINGSRILDGSLHTFGKLTFGTITMDNPEVLIVPDVMNHNADRSPMARNRAYLHNSDLILPELSLGMDVLKHLHLFLAFGEQALYIAPAEAVPGGPSRISTVKP